MTVAIPVFNGLVTLSIGFVIGAIEGIMKGKVHKEFIIIPF
jgi:hypothetical protein